MESKTKKKINKQLSRYLIKQCNNNNNNNNNNNTGPNPKPEPNSENNFSTKSLPPNNDTYTDNGLDIIFNYKELQDIPRLESKANERIELLDRYLIQQYNIDVEEMSSVNCNENHPLFIKYGKAAMQTYNTYLNPKEDKFKLFLTYTRPQIDKIASRTAQQIFINVSNYNHSYEYDQYNDYNYNNLIIFYNYKFSVYSYTQHITITMTTTITYTIVITII